MSETSPYAVFNWVILLMCTLAVITCAVGDALLQKPVVRSRVWVRAATDSLTHGVVGGLSWAAVIMSPDSVISVHKWTEVMVATMLASSVDVDHFVAAKSWSLKAATNLERRPILHASSLLIILILTIWMVQRVIPVFGKYASQLPWMLFVAWSSHHVRDAQRRGLWFPPFGSTPSIPYAVYLFIEFALPITVKYICYLYESIKTDLPSFTENMDSQA